MIGAFERYLEIYERLLLARAEAELSMEQEAEFAEEFDRCWHELSVDEQEELERRLASETTPDAPKDLGFVDALLAEGSTTAPRQAA